MTVRVTRYQYGSNWWRYTMGHGRVVGEWSGSRGKILDGPWMPYRWCSDFERALLITLIASGRDVA